MFRLLFIHRLRFPCLVGVLAILILSGCQKRGSNPVSEPPKPDVKGEEVAFPQGAPQLSSISVQTAQLRKLAIAHVSGRLCWNDDVTVHVFTPVLGRVTAIRSDLGARVVVGAPLAEIDSPDFAQALADARTALGNLTAADKAYARTKILKEHGAAAEKDFEAAQAAYVAALAERDRAAARLANYGGGDRYAEELKRSAGDRLEAIVASYAGKDPSTNARYILKSPLTGVLVDKAINPGQEVRPDQMLGGSVTVTAPLFVITDPSTLWLQVDVGESDLPALEPGLELCVSCKAFPDKVFHGAIDKVGAAMDPSTRTVKIRGVVKNPDLLLKAEMYVRVDVVRDQAGVAQAGVEVSAKALFMKGNDSYLFVEQTPNHFLRKQVKAGIEKDNKVPIFAGVDAGQKVVIEGALLLQALVEPEG